jgi:chitinase
VSHFGSKSSVSVRLRWQMGMLLLALGALLSGSAVVTYNYDAAGRLMSVTYDDGSTVTYTLDAAGNRKTVANAPPTPVTTPGSFAATVQSASQVKLTWTASTGGSGTYTYDVYRGGTLLTPGGVSALSYLDSALSTNTPYSYTVMAVDGDGNASAATSPVNSTTCPLPTISSFSGATASSSQINLSWSVSDSCGLGLAKSPYASYTLYRDGSLITTITSPSTTSYPDTGLLAASSHVYKLYAYDTGGNSANATANAGTYPLPSISSFTATTGSVSTITLSWAATDNGGPGGLTYSVTNSTLGRAVPNCTGVTAPPCTDSSLSAGSNNSYQLTAIDSKNDTATATASAWTLPGAPGTPTFSSVTATTATVSWTSASGTVTSYAYNLNNGSNWPNVGTNLTASLTGLSPSTPYTVLVHASNTGGTGANSSGSFTTPAAVGTFQYISGTQTNPGATGDIATATIKNSGTGTITGISYSCSGGSWHIYTIPPPPTSLAPGVSGSFTCQTAASGTYTVTFTLSGTNASNSPFSTPSF